MTEKHITIAIDGPGGAGKSTVADELAKRIVSIFEEKDGRRPTSAGAPYQGDLAWKDLILFHEYFHGETGAGLGANHQTGWTALLANILLDLQTEETPETTNT